MIFIKGNCILKVFCDVFASKKLEKEFIKAKYDENNTIEFLSYSTKIRHGKNMRKTASKNENYYLPK